MPNVAELIRDHVTPTVECIDRLYLNAYVPRLQSQGGVIGFLRQRGQKIPSPAVFGQITAACKTDLRAWCQAQHIPWLEFKKGERKDDVVESYRRSFINQTGVVPSLHVEYKRCHVKQYFKEGRALRTETTFNDTYDVGVAGV